MLFFLYGCSYLSFNDLLSYGYTVMMLNVLRSYITIKNLTWYRRHPEIRHCAATKAKDSYLLGLSP